MPAVHRLLLAVLTWPGVGAASLEGVIAISSSFFQGPWGEPTRACEGVPLNRTTHSQGQGKMYHSFGAGGGGELWRYGAVVMQLPRSESGLWRRPWLQLVLAARGHNLRRLREDVLFHVGALPEQVPTIPWRWEKWSNTSKCPPSYCLIPKVPSAAASMPECGWAPRLSPSVTVKGTLASGLLTVDADLGPIAAGNYTSVAISVTPARSPQLVMWQTPEFSIESADLYDADSILNV